MVADFKKRVDDYVKLREKGASAAPVELQDKSKPADIVTAEKSMAQKVREARAGRKAWRHLYARDPGDVPPLAAAAAHEERRRRREQGDHQRRRAGSRRKCRSR